MNDSLKQKEQNAIQALRSFEPDDGEGYYLCYSGGKDSDCIRILAELAGVKHDIVHNHTTVDAPETVYYVRSIPNVIIEKPEKSMWKLIAEKRMPPTRIVRYCCEELKERGGLGRLKITGVRKAESKAREDRSDLVNINGKAEIRFVRGRLRFTDSNGNPADRAPFPSMIVVYNGERKNGRK